VAGPGRTCGLGTVEFVTELRPGGGAAGECGSADATLGQGGACLAGAGTKGAHHGQVAPGGSGLDRGQGLVGVPSGMLCAPGRWPEAYSPGVRTSITMSSCRRLTAWPASRAVGVVIAFHLR
jgi:hypothetical protein